VKFDETEVPQFSFQLYENQNSSDELTLYPSLVTFKYPKAGQNISKVSVCVFDERTKAIRTVQLDNLGDDFYIPRIKWTHSLDQLAIFVLNRNQNQLKMFLANPKSTLSTLYYRKTTNIILIIKILMLANFCPTTNILFL
jgi:dipeptidyl-peptidase-4